MHHTIVVLLTRLHCNAMPVCAARLKPKTPAPCMQPTATNQQRAYTCLLHGHAEHATKSHAMPSCYNDVPSVLTCEFSSVHILYQLGLTELAQPRSKAPKGSVPAEPPPEPSWSRRWGHPGTTPQHPTCIDTDAGHMKHTSIQAYR